MSAKHIYLVNGRFDHTITPWNRGFAYGDGVFRTFAVHNSQPHCWSRHIRRLESDCNALGIVCPAEDILQADVEILFNQQDDEDSVMKIMVTRGESDRGYAVPALAQPTRVIMKTPFPQYPEHWFREGVELHLCKTRLGRQPLLAGIKHLNRLENILARMEWVDPHITDGLLLDENENVIECTSSNLFVRFGNTLATPDLSLCGVAGITRDRIFVIAKTLNYCVEIRPVPFSDFMKADEIIICNSLFSAFQVRKLNNTLWPIGVLAAHLRELLQIDD